MPVIKFEGPDGPEEYAVPLGPNSLLRLHLAEVRHVQRVADLTAVQLRDQVFSADPDPVAVTALVQVLWKREGRVVPFEQVDFDFSTFQMDLLPEEEAAAEAQEAAEAETATGQGEDPTPASSGDATAEG